MTSSIATPVLPDFRICHTKPLGKINIFANCLVDNPVNCPYAMTNFGDGYICKHMEWKSFVKP